jgi:lactate permease
MNYSSMTYTIGLALAATGRSLFPVIVVLLGTLGTVLTGSVAGSNALFGNLAVMVARRTGLDPAFIAAALASGGTMGKPLTPQNLVIASAAMGQGRGEGEGKLLLRVLGMTAIYTALLVLLILVQYYLFY